MPSRTALPCTSTVARMVQRSPDNEDPTIEEEYSCYSAAECEASAINTLRTLHGAQMTYQATTGAGNYGSLCQLAEDNLIPQLLKLCQFGSIKTGV